MRGHPAPSGRLEVSTRRTSRRRVTKDVPRVRPAPDDTGTAIREREENYRALFEEDWAVSGR